MTHLWQFQVLYVPGGSRSASGGDFLLFFDLEPSPLPLSALGILSKEDLVEDIFNDSVMTLEAAKDVEYSMEKGITVGGSSIIISEYQ